MSARPRRGLQGKDRKCFAIRGTLSGYCCANLGEMFGFRNGWGGFSCRAGGVPAVDWVGCGVGSGRVA